MDRRDFVALGALSLTATLLTGSGFAENPDPMGTRVWRTDPANRHQEVPVNTWKAEFANARPDLIVDDTRRYQPMLGFGGAFTDASCYLLSRLSSPQRSAFLKELLSPGQMNFSVGRCCIGASDYSTSPNIALVLTNRTYPRSVIVRHQDRTLNVHLPANSVTTVTWKGTSAA
jgi:O-glycosyl hydrolase